MTGFLSPAELKALTGSPFRARQIKWLASNGWLFSVDLNGRPKVAQAYFDRRMVGIETPAPPEQNAPDWAAAGL